ncbi:hypothetical protein FAES_0575 [Fibrella aestuarina BUZ 2]|uniref:Uncharacterized protein n=2 Tax=Fibrella TaxID=861914 RepID=I0K383_9BACT|nr:hypothetical protein FAES_0575 [Fibrella aestuarina BUZ 2]
MNAGTPRGRHSGFFALMARTKYHPSQLQIDFLAAFRQMLVSLGTPENLPQNEALFVRMTDQWESTRVIPADLLFQKSPVEAVVYRLKKQDDRLVFPADMIAGELRGTPGLTGFSAKFREQGWIILPAELSGMYKNLFLTILTASVGLEHLYANRRELLAEAERVGLASLLPEAEMKKFFGIKLSRFPDSFRSEVANYFNLPFDYVLKRAQHMGAVSDEAVEEANNPRAIRPGTLRKAVSSRAA